MRPRGSLVQANYPAIIKLAQCLPALHLTATLQRAMPWLDAGRKRLVGVQNPDNFIEMGIDLIGQVIKLTPLLTKARRLVGRMQQFAILPLDVVDDAPAVEASMQA